MSINLRNISVSLQLLLLLLFIVVGGSIPSVFGQNTSPNTTTSDIVDLFGNVTDREEGGVEQEDDDNSNFPQLNDVDGSNKDNSNDNSSSGASVPSPSSSSSTSSPSTTGQTVMIN